jgi:hypothetical protein
MSNKAFFISVLITRMTSYALEMLVLTPPFCFIPSKLLHVKIKRRKMSWFSRQFDAAAEEAVFQKGGYPALIKYKLGRIYHSTCGACCS